MQLIHRDLADVVNIGGQVYEADHDTHVFDIPEPDAQKLASFRGLWQTPEERAASEQEEKDNAITLKSLQYQVERLTAELAAAKAPAPTPKATPKAPAATRKS